MKDFVFQGVRFDVLSLSDFTFIGAIFKEKKELAYEIATFMFT